MNRERENNQTTYWFKRRAYASLYFGRSTGKALDLVYAVEPASRDVIWWKVAGTFTWEVHPYFDIHTGIDWNQFSSRDDRTFTAISAPSFELMGITWNHSPAAARRCATWVSPCEPSFSPGRSMRLISARSRAPSRRARKCSFRLDSSTISGCPVRCPDASTTAAIPGAVARAV